MWRGDPRRALLVSSASRSLLQRWREKALAGLDAGLEGSDRAIPENQLDAAMRRHRRSPRWRTKPLHARIECWASGRGRLNSGRHQGQSWASPRVRAAPAPGALRASASTRRWAARRRGRRRPRRGTLCADRRRPRASTVYRRGRPAVPGRACASTACALWRRALALMREHGRLWRARQGKGQER